MTFFSFTIPHSNKTLTIKDGSVYEKALRGRKLSPGIYEFKEDGFYAEAVGVGEAYDVIDLYDGLNLPKVGMVTLEKVGRNWFCLPINDNQLSKYTKAKAPLPLLYAPERLGQLDAVHARVLKRGRIYLLFEDYNDNTPEVLGRIREIVPKISRHMDIKAQSRLLKTTKELRRIFEIIAEKHVPPMERILKEALAIASAKLIKWDDEGYNRYAVTFGYNNRNYNVVVDDNLMVVDAGICLVTHDRRHTGDVRHMYDLTTIVHIVAGRHQRRGEWI